MCKVLEVTGAEQITGHPHSLALTGPDRVTFVKAASREDARWWAELLAVFPRRHKRNATFPGGRASPSLPQLGRSASPQPPRPRHLSAAGRPTFDTPPLKEEAEISTRPPPSRAVAIGTTGINPGGGPATAAITVGGSSSRSEYMVSSGSPPTRDKRDSMSTSGVQPGRMASEDKPGARARRDWRHERLRDIAAALTTGAGTQDGGGEVKLDGGGREVQEQSLPALPAEQLLLHLKKGWLWIKSPEAGVDWSRRWVVLCGPSLQVYADQDERSPPELRVELSSVVSYAETVTDSKYSFEIRRAGGPPVTLAAVTQGIRSNWLLALKKAAPMATIGGAANGSTPPPPVESPVSPSTPRSIMASSDEEYKTASEGGRRGSEEWSSTPGSTDLPPSPPPSHRGGPNSLGRLKERARVRPRLPRSGAPGSRHSTADSTSTDELDCVVKPQLPQQDVHQLREKLAGAEKEIQALEEEIARLKEFQSDAAIREKKAKEMLSNLEKNEMELNQRNSQIELNFLKEQRALQRRLSEAEEAARTNEEKCTILTRELQTKQRILLNLQEELSMSNERLSRVTEENNRLYKKVQELEGRYCFKNKHFKADSITELTNINLDLDIDELNANELKEYCLDLKYRFERAIVEIQAVKRALRESEESCDKMEIANYGLAHHIGTVNEEHAAEVRLLVQRLENLTAKLAAAERQLKTKGKGDAKDKRRSLSLRGRESFSINKEVEDKVTELEAKILALERGRNRRRYKRDRSNERCSPIDDKALRRARRKSLDSATSSEPMKLLMRLSSLETKVTNVNTSNESLNILNGSTSDITKLKDEKSSVDLEYLLSTAKIKVNECLCSVSALKNNRKRNSSPSADKLVALENSLNELNDILNRKDCVVSIAEVEVINTSAGSVVKQLQNLLLEKLTSLAEKKRLLQENNNWDNSARLQILAEKVAYENVLVNRIQEALTCPVTGEAVCERLINKETRETAYLIIALQNKINGTSNKQQPPNRTSVDHLTKTLAKCLLSASQGFKSFKNFVATKGPSIDLLYDEKQKLDALLGTYKSAKLPQIAEALAAETMNLASDKACRLRSLKEDLVNEFKKNAREIVNSELIQSEINHVLLRAAQVYQSNIDADHNFFFSFFASERAALELWSDAVGDCLYDEISRAILELTELYQNCLNKLQKQNWRRRVELERNSRAPTTLLYEFADVVAHKALIDARIAVLSGNYNPQEMYSGSVETLSTWLDNEKQWAYMETQSLLQTNRDLEVEFTCMVEKYRNECHALLEPRELVAGCLRELSEKVEELQRCADLPVRDISENWKDVCQACATLRDRLEEVRIVMQQQQDNPQQQLRRYSPVPLDMDPLEDDLQLHQSTAEYLSEVEQLRGAWRRALAGSPDGLRESEAERLRQLCERALAATERWHRGALQAARRAHQRQVDALKQEKEQALAEETRATLAALDAMRKAHVAEVQREVAKFKQEYARQQRDDIFELSEKLSVKSLEAAALEEQLGSATRQLAHAQQHILKLERNPQLSSVKVIV
ncbi:unnamed protein product [Callosobruchus maculatus]|uniref:PH domain-containing protein n=1 Tax=Callosobruchus maculatus TaxID=64391 RepID=A0A653CPX9_CALMS|nr:unnamed protein product [Callosobruchus maculatus]